MGAFYNYNNTYGGSYATGTTYPYSVTWPQPIYQQQQPVYLTTTEESNEVSEQEFTVGDGSTTSFTFSTHEKYPAVAVFTRSVEGEGKEEVVTLQQVHPTVEIVSNETVTVKFDTAPARRGAIVLIG